MAKARGEEGAMRRLGAAAAVLNFGMLAGIAAGQGTPIPAPVVLDDDGGWCWFEDERAVFVDEQTLVVGTVASGAIDPTRKGDIVAVVHDLATGKTASVELHDRLSLDDHNSPAFLVRPDRRVLAVYGRHGPDDHFFYRVSEPGDPTRWGPTRAFTPSRKTRLTYSNVFRLESEGGRVYDFFRGFDGTMKPSFAVSDDGGDTWRAGGIVIRSPAVRPYVKYASDGRDAIHLVYTEGHPRDADNSLYHVVYRAGTLRRSDGTPVAPLERGLDRPEEGTRVFRGDPDHVAWPCDVALDADGRPRVAYSVQVNSAGMPPRTGGDDIDYRFAAWDGARWRDHALAHGGTRLYAGEDDYSGLVALDPDRLDTLYLSTDVDPVTASPLVSAADGKRHHEVFRGVTPDGGASWRFEPITKDSTADNLRPIVPRGVGPRTALLWLRGSFRSFTDYHQSVMMIPLDRPAATAGR
jgi:hypothetical protein